MAAIYRVNSSIIGTDKGCRSSNNIDDEDAPGCSAATDSSRRPKDRCSSIGR
jgi:hypothetical protein